MESGNKKYLRMGAAIFAGFAAVAGAILTVNFIDREYNIKYYKKGGTI